MGWQMLQQDHLNGENVKRRKVGGRNSETTHGVQSVRACNHLEDCIISCNSNWSVIPLEPTILFFLKKQIN